MFGARRCRAWANRAVSRCRSSTAPGSGMQALQEATETVVAKANAQPGLARVFTTFAAERAAAVSRHRPRRE